MNATRYARVLLDRRARALDQGLHYHIPIELTKEIAVGSRVQVPLARGLATGFVLAIDDEDPGFPTKAIRRLLDGPDGPELSLEQIELAHWLARYYGCLLTDAVGALLPPGQQVHVKTWIQLLPSVAAALREAKDQDVWDQLAATAGQDEDKDKDKRLRALLSFLAAQKGRVSMEQIRQQFAWPVGPMVEALSTAGIVTIAERTLGTKRLPQLVHVVQVGDETKQRLTPKQRRLYGALCAQPQPMPLSRAAELPEYTPAIWSKLKALSLVQLEDDLGGSAPVTPDSSPPALTDEQSEVLQAIGTALNEERPRPLLLHGVTGSGKTEVYLQAIARCIAQGRQAIVLVPEIALTPQMVERFRSRFGEAVVVLHSSLSQTERYVAWTALRRGAAQVVVGARSAVFAPVRRLGLVIIDEEHENTYKQEDDPKYHTREVALWRGAYHGAAVVMGSATPAVESFYRALQGEYQLLVMKHRVSMQPLPVVHVIDMRQELQAGWRSMFSRALTTKLQDVLARGEQAILFLNRRGYSRFALCRACGEVLKCPHCEISLVQHLSEDHLRCHYCGYTIRLPKTCPHCSSSYLRYFGVGTEKVEEECRRLFPDVKILRMDADTTARRGSHEAIYRAFARREAQILVGTQMVAKGLDFPHVTLVGVLAADAILRFPDYRAGERAFSLLTQVAGRAGRGTLGGEVVIQSYEPSHPSVVYACQHDYRSFYDHEIEVRRRQQMPPFAHLALVTASGLDDQRVEAALKDVARGLAVSPIRLTGPQRAGVAKVKDRWRWQLWARSTDREMVGETVSLLLQRSSYRNDVQLSLCIDPLTF